MIKKFDKNAMLLECFENFTDFCVEVGETDPDLQR